MRYYLAELYITKRKFLGVYLSFPHKVSMTLVEAPDWKSADIKTQKWAAQRAEQLGLKGKFKYVAFTTSPE